MKRFANRGARLAMAMLSFATILQAGIVADALFSLPAQTEYLEYDNLAALRRLPNYQTLRENFSGKPLEEAKSVLSQLGVEEDQVQEIVSASSSTAFYGLAGGTFSGETVTRNARNKRFAEKLLNDRVFCTGRPTCVVFLEDSLAAFGGIDQLRKLLLVRQGAAARFTSNSEAVRLLNDTDRAAPVRGILFGQQLWTAVSEMLPDSSGLPIDRSRLTTTVTGIGYAVTFGSKAHVSATLECSSGTAAALLSQMLNTVGTVQSLTARVTSSAATLPFRDMRATSAGNTIRFQAEAVIPPSPNTAH